MDDNIRKSNLYGEEEQRADSVLIVDDSEINRIMLKRLLKDTYSVYEAENGHEALEVLRHEGNRISLILLDIIMPVMDGFEFLRAKRRETAIADIPVIVMTGAEIREAEIKSLEFGADDFIGKPYEPAIVRLRIANMINSRKLSHRKNTIEYFMNNIPVGICICVFDDKSQITFASEGILQSSEYSSEEFINNFGNDVSQYIHPDNRIEIDQRIMDSVEKKADIDVVARVLTKSGELRWNHFSGRFVYFENGKPVYYIVISDVTEHRKTELMLYEQNKLNRQQETELMMMYSQLQNALAHTAIEVWQYDIHEELISLRFNANIKGEHHERISVVEISELDKCILPEDRESFRLLFKRLDSGQSPVEAEIRMFRDGSFKWYRLTFTTVVDMENNPVTAIGICRDVNSEVDIRKQYEKEVKYRLSQSEGAILSAECDLDTGQLIDIGNAFGSYGFIRYDSGGMVSIETFEKCVHPEDRNAIDVLHDMDSLLKEFRKGRKEISFECRLLSPRKLYEGYRWMSVTFSCLIDPETARPHIFICIRDINDKKESELEYRKKAQQDSLTNLVNRATFQELVTRSLENSDEGSLSIFIILDLDDFKGINDTYGHAYGDEVLRFSAKRLMSLFRSHDIVARLGGDELAVYMTNISDSRIARKKGREICDALNGWRHGTKGIELSCSVGIAISPKHGESFDTLYKNADAALYKAKKSGKNRYVVYGDE